MGISLGLASRDCGRPPISTASFAGLVASGGDAARPDRRASETKLYKGQCVEKTRKIVRIVSRNNRIPRFY
jgi:hypothetical protein